MTAIDDILGKLSIQQLAAQLGSDPDTIQQAAGEAIASLMGGLQQNSTQPLGQRSLAAALKQHQGSNLLDTEIDLNQIDQTDGTKIVQHVLGADPATAARNLGTRSEAGLIQRLLPMLAPLVLSYLASRVGNRQIEAGRQQEQQQQGGSILDSILGRSGPQDTRPSEDYQRGYQDGYEAAKTEAQQSGGMGLADIIGGMMGGTQQRPQQGGLGGLLGGLFS